MLVSREFRFDAAHHLVDYGGKCERLHGHTWSLRVTIEAPVGPNGLAFDFVALDRIVRERAISALDHTDLNEVVGQPSCENVAIWIWERLRDLPLREVRVHESPTSFVTYRGPEREPRGGPDVSAADAREP